ncbi:MAG: hypothetical protein ABIJ45_02150 [Candidatus Zixiibacteriota bacterium]
MKVKFDLEKEYLEYVDLIQQVKAQTSELSRLLDIVQNRSVIHKTAFELSNISIETVDCIIMNLKYGYLAQVQVLIRWYLEMCHLSRYLIDNDDKYKKWLKGDKVRPKDIGVYFEKILKFPSWKYYYNELSEYIHFNPIFIENHYRIELSNHEEVDLHELLVEQSLANVMLLSQKFNYAILEALKSPMGSDFNILKNKCNKVGAQVDEIYRDHLERERKKLESS